MSTHAATGTANRLSEIKEMLAQTLRDIAHDIEEQRTGNCVDQLENIIKILLDEMNQMNEEHDSVIDLILEAVHILKEDTSETRYQPKLHYSSMKGRPSYQIMEDILSYYIDNGFSLNDIAHSLNVSVRTVSRRLEEYNLSMHKSFSLISDAELDQIVSEKVKEFPNSGYRTVYGHLLSEGIRVQRERVQESVKRVDPCGVAVRKLFMQHYRIQRRRYSVKSSMALWHVDTNHKLIRWRFVIHAGIDGYSRLPTYVVAASDNTAATALKAFKFGVSKYGLPERVRSDKGRENVRIAEYMLQRRGVNSNSHITGRSVHNQRIERFWREVWQGCTSAYYQLFRKMEEEAILDVDSELDILVLHQVYLERMQASLSRFQQAVSRRPLRTEGNKSPLQLWILGQMQNPRDDISDEAVADYGIDFEGPPDMNPEEDIVVPPLFNIPDHIMTEVDRLKALSANCDMFESDTFTSVQQYLKSQYIQH